MPVTHGGPAPYAPPQNVLDIIEAYRDRGLATPFTADVLIRAGVSETLASRVLATLKLLDLIADTGNPTPTLEGLKGARGEDYKAALAEWLNATYADVLRYTDPVQDGPDRIGEAFRGCEPNGQRTRMVTLMLGLFEYAGLIPEGKRGSASDRKARPPKKPPSVGAKARTTRTNKTSASQSIDVVEDLPPALIGLLRQIPFQDGWTAERRESFMTAFAATLDFSVPIATASPPGQGEEEDEDR